MTQTMKIVFKLSLKIEEHERSIKITEYENNNNNRKLIYYSMLLKDSEIMFDLKKQVVTYFAQAHNLG